MFDGNGQLTGGPVTITGIPLAAPTTHGFRETVPSKAPGDTAACDGPPFTVTAIGPTGQIGWVRSGCSATTYAFRTGEHSSLVRATLPTDDQEFYAESLQYTPAGTAVMLLTRQDCTLLPDRAAVVRGNSDHAVGLPSNTRQCG